MPYSKNNRRSEFTPSVHKNYVSDGFKLAGDGVTQVPKHKLCSVCHEPVIVYCRVNNPYNVLAICSNPECYKHLSPQYGWIKQCDAPKITLPLIKKVHNDI